MHLIVGMSNSKRKNFVFCVDLDGVVADYDAAFRAFVAEETNQDPASLPPQETWDFTGVWGIRDRQHYIELHNKAVNEGMFMNMPLVKGASEALWRLNDEHEIHIRIVTHRLIIKGGHDTAVRDTVSWLQRRREDGRPIIPYRDICFIADKAEVGGDLYIDDAPHNVEALRGQGFQVIVMDHAYNRHLDGPRARDWQEVEQLVLAKMRWMAEDPLHSEPAN
jgi:5'-nucleotidase